MHKDQKLIMELHKISALKIDSCPEEAVDILRNINIITKQHLEVKQPKQEAVNHPTHYRPGTYEAINVIQAWKLDFALGNVIKYVCRAGLKDPEKNIEDLNKALAYLKAHIQYKENQR
jgi:hypothetical protein